MIDKGHMPRQHMPPPMPRKHGQMGTYLLTWRDLPACLFAWFGLARMTLWLRWRGLAWVWQRARRPTPLRLPLTPMPPQRLAFLINVAAHYAPFPTTCLSRALFLWSWLRQVGLQPNLRLGVRKQGETLLAHAWVEVEDTILNDDPLHVAQYAPFDLVEANGLPGRYWL